MVYLFIAAIFYAAALLFGTAAARNVNSNLAVGITNILAMVIPLAVAFPYIKKETFQHHRFGIIMALCSGACIAIFGMALNKSLP